MNIPACLEYLSPGAEWSLTQNDYATLKWIGPGEKPILAELEAAWLAAQRASVVVSFRSLAFTLQSLGLYAQVKAAALSTTEGEIWWNTAQSTMVSRGHPFVATLGESLGQTPEQLDAIFAAALKLPQA